MHPVFQKAAQRRCPASQHQRRRLELAPPRGVLAPPEFEAIQPAGVFMDRCVSAVMAAEKSGRVSFTLDIGKRAVRLERDWPECGSSSMDAV